MQLGPKFVRRADQAVNAPSIGRLKGGAECVRVGTRPRQLAERYSGTVGTGASGWDAQAERSMAMAAYAMTTVTTQRISVR
jgi:hypothetical protein